MAVIALTSACTQVRQNTISPTNVVISPPTQIPDPTQISAPTQLPVTTSSELVTCRPYLCSTAEFWTLEANGPEALPLPIKPWFSYDATAATGRLLYSTKFPDHRAGPGKLSLGDLWWLDVRSVQTRSIISDEVIVGAEWESNGQSFVYVRAAPQTYELHWYTLAGEDKLLAIDVATVFSVSQAGDKVAFTRESNYNLGGTPGLYVIDIATGQERQISSVDRAGRGSALDKPIWSPDGKRILLPVSGDVNIWIIVAVDGTGSNQLNVSPEVSDKLNNFSLGFVLWRPDGVHLVGSSFPGMQGGSSKVVLFSLNPALDTVISALVNPGACGPNQHKGWRSLQPLHIFFL